MKMHDIQSFSLKPTSQKGKGKRIMHLNGFLHKTLSSVITSPQINNLSCLVRTAITSKNLTLTGLGRALEAPIQERSGIQKVNRFLGNEHVRDKLQEISEHVAKLLIQNHRPIIIVDWTKYPNSHDAVLRAAIPFQGRALTIYEERHRENKTGVRRILEAFLVTLKKILPQNCKPIIVTDAGFHNPWFKKVTQLNWGYIGRVRGIKHCQLSTEHSFKPCKDLYKQASLNIVEMGEGLVAKTNPLKTQFYLVRSRKKRRKDYTRSGQVNQTKNSRDYARSHHEPWLLISSLKGRHAAKRIEKIYRRRMEIEESFRDLKSTEYGFGLERGKTKKGKRRDILLLIARLSHLVAAIIGVHCEKLKLHYQFQSNSIKNRRVISIFYLGCQVFKRKPVFRLLKIPDMLKTFISLLKNEAYCEL